MRPRRLLPIVLLLCLTPGCLVMSLRPWFSEKVTVREATLLGSWVGSDGNSRLMFKEAHQNLYAVTYSQSLDSASHADKEHRGEPAEFEGRLGRIGGSLFLDLYPAEGSWDRLRNDLLAVHLAPTHTISRIWLAVDTLRIGGLDLGWLKRKLQKNPSVLRHESLDGAIVITAPTKSLQSFLSRYQADSAAFPSSETFRRQP